MHEGLDDAALEARLFSGAAIPATTSRLLPDWAEVDRELRSKKNVTLALLHLEYKEQHPDGYQYTQFCRHYRAWRRTVDVVMRQEHKAGEKCFVAWAGQSVPVIDPARGEITLEAQIFVAVLGASNYTYAEAFPSQELVHWISAHVHAFRSVFEEIERPALRPLSATRYQFALWKTATVNIDYHSEVDHYDSVPYQLAREVVDVRISASTVAVFRGGRRVASHLRSSVRGPKGRDRRPPLWSRG